MKEMPEFPAIRVRSMSKKQSFWMESSFPHPKNAGKISPPEGKKSRAESMIPFIRRVRIVARAESFKIKSALPLSALKKGAGEPNLCTLFKYFNAIRAKC